MHRSSESLRRELSKDREFAASNVSSASLSVQLFAGQLRLDHGSRDENPAHPTIGKTDPDMLFRRRNQRHGELTAVIIGKLDQGQVLEQGEGFTEVLVLETRVTGQ